MFNPAHHHHRSIRLPQYDYTQSGAYFVTVVTDQRALLFNDAVLRQIVETFWQRLPQHVPQVNLDAFILMPNHFHGILWLLNANLAAAQDNAVRRPPRPVAGSLGAIIGNFKSITTRRINQVRKTPGQPVWQRNYYERVIRHDKELNAIRQYILDNPVNWSQDTENPDRSV